MSIRDDLFRLLDEEYEKELCSMNHKPYIIGTTEFFRIADELNLFSGIDRYVLPDTFECKEVNKHD